MEVLVFATNVEKPQQVSKVKPLLAAVPAINHWNFDLEDCDNVLRIEANGLCPREVEILLQRAGFKCDELM